MYLKIILVFICYLLLIFLEKVLIMKANNKTIKNKEYTKCFQHVLSIVSPDYFITLIMKSKLKRNINKLSTVTNENMSEENEKRNKDEMAKIIKSFNKWNILISLITLVIAIVMKLIPFFDCLYLKALIFIRYISRIIEIIISFVKDIIEQNNHSSSLQKRDREELAIKSLFEMLILEIACILLVIQNVNLLELCIYSIEPVFSEFNCCNSYINFIQLLFASSFYALVILYLSNLLSKDDNY